MIIDERDDPNLILQANFDESLKTFQEFEVGSQSFELGADEMESCSSKDLLVQTDNVFANIEEVEMNRLLQPNWLHILVVEDPRKVFIKRAQKISAQNYQDTIIKELKHQCLLMKINKLGLQNEHGMVSHERHQNNLINR